MASWRDGAAYAPTERPDGFATPLAEPLSVADPPRRVTPGNVPRPTTLTPVAAPPLEALGTTPAGARNPSAPFEVRSTIVTQAPRLADGRRDPRVPYDVRHFSTNNTSPGAGYSGLSAPSEPASGAAALSQLPSPTALPRRAAGGPQYPYPGRFAPTAPPPAERTPQMGYVWASLGLIALCVLFPALTPLALFITSALLVASRISDYVPALISLAFGVAFLFGYSLLNHLDWSWPLFLLASGFALYYCLLILRR